MTNPPQGSDEPGRIPAERSDPDRHPPRPVPSVGVPLPTGGGPARPPSQPYAAYGRPQPAHQPRYGQQPSSPAQGPAARRSRVGLIAAVTLGIVAVVAVGVVLALTMSSTVLDRNAVQEDVAAQFEEREGVAIDLECAEEMEVAQGATYECTGTTADGEDVTLRIVITDEDTAAYTWTEP